MPGPGVYRGGKLVDAYRAGLVGAMAIRDASRRILRLIDRAGAFDNAAIAAERVEDLTATRALIRRAGVEGMVLLKNQGALPLVPRRGATIAVTGPNAQTTRAMGGGSAQLNPHYLVAPYDALGEALCEEVALTYELGADNRRLAAAMKGDIVADYDGTDFAGPIRRTIETRDGVLMFMGCEGLGVDVCNLSARLRTAQTPEVSRDHHSLISTGPSRLYVDGELVVDNCDFAYREEYFATASSESTGLRGLEAGKTYEITAEWRSPDHREGLGLIVLRMGLSPVIGLDAVERAVALSKSADAALLFVGLNGEWDSDDRPNLDLPGHHNELICRVAESNPNSIVVFQSGGPVLIPWLDKVAAVLQAWYSGQEKLAMQSPMCCSARQNPADVASDVPMPPRRSDAHQLSR
jgi:beta-glucosidase